MAITSQTDKIGPTLISGLPQTIPIFAFQTSSDLLVLDTGPTSGPYDPATVLNLGSDYTVSGGGYNASNQMQTGSVTVNSGGTGNVQINDNIVVMRAVPINQPTSLINTGPLTIALVEQMGDRLATISQELNENISRCLQFENFEFINGTLSLASRKGMILAFDSNGNPIFLTGSLGSSLTNAVLLGTVTLPSGNTLTGAAGVDIFSGRMQVQGGIKGVTNATNATAGNVGEYIEAEVASNTVTLTNVTTANAFGTSTAAITLTAGDWDVGGSIYILAASATVTQLIASISTTTASLTPTAGTLSVIQPFTTTSYSLKLPMPVQRLSVSTSTPIYLNVNLAFSAGSAAAGGVVWARRSANAK